jgi:hypothetical protein
MAGFIILREGPKGKGARDAAAGALTLLRADDSVGVRGRCSSAAEQLIRNFHPAGLRKSPRLLACLATPLHFRRLLF